MQVTYFTKETLLRGQQLAESINANRQLKVVGIETLPDDLKFPVVFNMLHERGQSIEIRCQILIGPDAAHLTAVWLDVPIEFFNELPVKVVDVPADLS